jgi:hypothetical protein
MTVHPIAMDGCPTMTTVAYIRIYGPEAPAFRGSWKPGDFDLVD